MILEGYGSYSNSGNNVYFYSYRGKRIPVPKDLYQSFKTYRNDGPNAPGTQPFHRWKMAVEKILDYEAGEVKPVVDIGDGSLSDTLHGVGDALINNFGNGINNTIVDAYNQIIGNGSTTTRVPTSGSGAAVDAGTVTAPATEFDSYEAYLNMLKEISEANNAFNIEQAQKQMDWQSNENKIMMDFNAEEAEKNRVWQQYMSDTAYQRQTADLQAAGLNPILAINGGNGAPISSGATAYASSNGSGAKATADTVFASAMLSMFNSAMDVAEKSAEASISANKVAYSNTSSDSGINLKNILGIAKDIISVGRGLKYIFS